MVKKTGKKKPPPTQDNTKVGKKTRKHTSGSKEAIIAMLRKRVPKTAAVIKGKPTGEGTTLTSVMRKVAAEINLKTLGEEIKNTRRTNAGGILLELNTEEDTDRLADQIRRTLGPSTLVGRRSCTTPVFLLDIPICNTEEELGQELIREGVLPDDLAAECIKITIRTNSGDRGDRIARVDTPVPTAIWLAEIRHVKVGWTRCRVKLLDRKQPTCFRCQERDHIAAQCKCTPKDRQCYRCSRPGHLARDCIEKQPNRSQKKTQRVEGAKTAIPNSEDNRANGVIHTNTGVATGTTDNEG